MKQLTRPAHLQDETNLRGENRPAEHGSRIGHRMRVLLFACSANDAQRALKYGDRTEIAFLPSYDIEEIQREIAHFKPRLVTCRADVFLSLSSRPPPGSPVHSRRQNIGIADALPAVPVSPRESKALAMIAEGKTNDEIARALHLSVRTVKRILSDLFEQFRVSNRTELASHAAKLRLHEKDS